MKKVLLSQKIHEDAMQYLREKNVELILSESPDPQIVKKYIVDADAVIIRTATKLSADLIEAGKKIKVIARTGAGVDNVDVAFASSKNIPVCNTPMANMDSVAEHTIALIFALSKYLFLMDQSVKNGDFDIRNRYLPSDLASKTLGLVGFGNIGRKVANICSNCFGMHILVYDPYLKSIPEKDSNIKLAGSLKEIFLKSDFISLHLPYTKDNHHMINKEMLTSMKKSAFIINTARGGIIDENALYEILESNKIAGAALDVFENEPPDKKSPLFNLNNIILTPHSAALTKESSRRMAMHAAEGVIDILENKKARWVCNIDNITL